MVVSRYCLIALYAPPTPRLIKKTQIPIICIANDKDVGIVHHAVCADLLLSLHPSPLPHSRSRRTPSQSQKMRNFKNHCFTLPFRKPVAKQVIAALKTICIREGGWRLVARKTAGRM